MRVTIAYAVVLVLSITLFFVSVGRIEAPLWNFLNELSKITFGSTLGYFLYLFVENFDLVKAYLKLFRHRLWNEEIRFSYSYLFRIQIQDQRGIVRYLLVRSGNLKYRAFQPPGGVYKVFSTSELNQIGTRPADNFYKLGDVRVHLRGRTLKNLLRYVSKNSNIELDHGREFHEELIEKGILPRDLFPYLDVIKCGQETTGVRYSPSLDIYEYNVYDILEVKLTRAQENAVTSLLTDQRLGEQFVFASAQTIKTGGMDKDSNIEEFKITEHTPKIIGT